MLTPETLALRFGFFVRLPSSSLCAGCCHSSISSKSAGRCAGSWAARAGDGLVPAPREMQTCSSCVIKCKISTATTEAKIGAAFPGGCCRGPLSVSEKSSGTDHVTATTDTRPGRERRGGARPGTGRDGTGTGRQRRARGKGGSLQVLKSAFPRMSVRGS